MLASFVEKFTTLKRCKIVLPKVNRFCPAQNFKMSHLNKRYTVPALACKSILIAKYGFICVADRFQIPPNSFNFQNGNTFNTWTMNAFECTCIRSFSGIAISFHLQPFTKYTFTSCIIIIVPLTLLPMSRYQFKFVLAI